MKILVFFLIIFGCILQSNAQIGISNAAPNNNAASIVQNILVGNGVVVSNISFTGNSQQIGVFNSGSSIGMPSGIVMSSGYALDADLGGSPLSWNTPNNGILCNVNPNTVCNDLYTVANSVPVLVGQSFSVSNINDMCVLEFDFVPESDTLRFNYCFGSEEYLDYVNSNWNDVFGFFVSGPGISGNYSSPAGFPNGSINIANVPNSNPSLPITVSSIHPFIPATVLNPSYPSVNGQYYNTGNTNISYNGYTDVFTAEVIVQPCETYHIRLAIADGSDDWVDSGVFLEANSFSSPLASILSNGASIISDTLTIACNGSIDLEAQINGIYSILWNTGDTSSIITVTEGDYFFSVTNGSCVFYSDTITVKELIQFISTTTLTVCESLVWNGITHYASGLYQDTIIKSDGCDSIASLYLTILNPTTSITILTVCNDLVWNGITYNTSGLYVDTLINSVGCDSIASLYLTILNPTISTTTLDVCDSLVWNGITYTVSGVYIDTLTNSNGCDSLTTLILTVLEHSFSVTNIILCNTTYLWNGITYTVSGLYIDTLINSAGCDSVTSLDLTIINSSTSTTTLTVCDSLDWNMVNGITYTSSGVYVDTLVNSVGCDIVATLNLTILNSSSSTTMLTVCDSYLWNGITYTSSGVYTFNTLNSNGCDSVANLNLSILGESSSITNITLNDTDTFYLWNGVTYTTSGVYTFITLNSVGCDSIASLNISIFDSSANSSNSIFCDSLVWNGTTYTTSGFYVDTLINSFGSDSVASLNLIINSSTNSLNVYTFCNSYLWNGITQTITGLYVDTLTNSVGCDSVASLDLTIINSSSSTTTLTVCDSSVWNGITYSNSGLYIDTLINFVSCDSVASLDLTIINSSPSTIVLTVCDSLVWNGITYNNSGLYVDTLTNSVGCDIVASLDLIIINSSSSTTTLTVCDSYLWNGILYTSSGFYVDTLVNSVGCDSVSSLNLSILVQSSSVTNITLTDTTYLWNGVTHTISGLYVDTLINSVGCDSLVTLNLTILNSSSSNTNLSVCDSYLWNGINYTVSGLYVDTLINSIGIDSIASLYLTVSNSSTNPTILTVCDSIIWNGIIYTLSGFYIDSLTNSFGCDSIVSLDLTVLISSSSTIALTVCDSLVWNNITYNTSGLYVDTLINSIGCDSVTNLNLTILVNSSSVTNITLCDSSYLWGRYIYSNSGTYSFTLTNSVGCDSIAFLNLIINSISTSINFDTACYSYLWNGITYINSGLYIDTLTNSVGCDSIASLYLTILNSTTSITTLTICDSIVWNALTYTISGLYVKNLINSAGCDSIAVLDLTVLNSSSSTITITVCDSLFWNGTTYNTSGFYTFNTLNSFSCDSIISLNLTIKKSTSSTIIHNSCNNSYFWNGINYDTSGQYVFNSMNSVGCDSTAFLKLFINSSSTSLTIDTACDSYLWNGLIYDTTGIYDTTFTSSNIFGCDSTSVLYLTINSSTNIYSTDINFITSDYNSYNISCNGESDGWIKIDIIGGSPPFIFDWNISSNSDSIFNLIAYDYLCTITDDLGCSISETVSLTEPDILKTDILVLSNYNNYAVSCYLGNDGVIMANITGGINPYKLIWSNQKSSDTLYDLSVGAYEIDVEDINGCFSNQTIAIYSPDSLVSNVSVYTDTCERGVGAANLIISGGVKPYSYIWSNGNDSSFANNLFSGKNSYFVIDANDCSLFMNVNIENMIGPEVSFNVIPTQRRFYDQLDNPFIYFDNSKTNGHNIDNWYWEFGDGNYSYDSLVTHSYSYMDTFIVSLIIETDYNCIDTVSKQLIVNDYQLFIPNAFTPNTNDDYNDEFRAYGYGISNYSMTIYNRWGEIIFNSYDIEIGWKGYLNNGNIVAPIGVYAYRIQVVNIFGEINNYVGQLKLLK